MSDPVATDGEMHPAIDALTLKKMHSVCRYLLVDSRTSIPPQIRKEALAVLLAVPGLTIGAYLVSSEAFASIQCAAWEGKKILAIKLFRGATGLGLKESKDAIDAEFFTPRGHRVNEGEE